MATKTPKTRTETFTGEVARCDLKVRKPFQPHYYSQAEHNEWYLDMAVKLDDGRVLYFKTPAFPETIASCPMAAVVTYGGYGECLNWIKESWPTGEERRAVAVPGTPNNNGPMAQVRIGDRVTVSGRIKAEKVSKAGNAYVTITHVRKLETV